MITFINDIKLKIKCKLCKQNNIRVIAVLPNGKTVEAIRTWEKDSVKGNVRKPDIKHEKLIEEKIMKQLIDRGYPMPPLLKTNGILGRYPLMASLIRDYSIAFVLKSYIIGNNYDIVISCIPNNITKEQYKIINKMNGNNIDSICYDDYNNFSIIDKPLKTYVKSRIK